MENTFTLKIGFNKNDYNLIIPKKADYLQFIENIKS